MIGVLVVVRKRGNWPGSQWVPSFPSPSRMIGRELTHLIRQSVCTITATQGKKKLPFLCHGKWEPTIFNGFDKFIIICSGDLASSGSDNDYKRVKFVFGNLLAKLKDKYPNIGFINLLIVPGNHDANFTGITRCFSTIQQYYKDNEIEEHIETELNMLKYFYSFAERNNCFKVEKICERKFIYLGKYVIQANLINTALFSTLIPDDKELHYFPNAKLSNLIKQDKADITITIMHHSPEWFHCDCKSNLEKAIYNNSSILFLGHDHNLSTKDLNINNYNNIFISAGGQFSNIDIVGKSEFNVILLNTDTNHLDSYAFEWNDTVKIYSHTLLYENKEVAIKFNKLMPSRLFLNALKEDEKRKISKDFTKYFVFPALTGKYKDEYSETVRILNMDNFINELRKRKYINIVGSENSGKTTLLKAIFLNIISDSAPLLFSLESIKGKNPEKIIKHAFEEQYSDDPLEYQKYQQLDKDRKVAIIDDFDMIKSEKVKKDIVALLKSQCNYIILATKNLEEYDIINNVRSEIDEKNIFYALKINQFYLKKRHDLIRNICKVLTDINDEDIDKIVREINGFIRHQLQLFNLDPTLLYSLHNMFYSLKICRILKMKLFLTKYLKLIYIIL